MHKKEAKDGKYNLQEITDTFDSFFDVEDFFMVTKKLEDKVIESSYLEYDMPICENFRSFYRDFLEELFKDALDRDLQEADLADGLTEEEYKNFEDKGLTKE